MSGFRFRSPLVASTLVSVLAAACWLAAPPEAVAAAREDVNRGVVQEVSPTAITLRALDGSSLTITIGPGTMIRVNGRAASLSTVRPGFVATAFHDGAAPARLVRAVGTLAREVAQGTVVRRANGVLTVRTDAGTVLEVRLGARTAIRRTNGVPARRGALRPGRWVRITYVPGRVADLVVVGRG